MSAAGVVDYEAEGRRRAEALWEVWGWRLGLPRSERDRFVHCVGHEIANALGMAARHADARVAEAVAAENAACVAVADERRYRHARDYREACKYEAACRDIAAAIRARRAPGAGGARGRDATGGNDDLA